MMDFSGVQLPSFKHGLLALFFILLVFGASLGFSALLYSGLYWVMIPHDIVQEAKITFMPVVHNDSAN